MTECKIVDSILTENPCYKANRKINVQGIMLHSVGCSQPSASVFVKKWNKASYTSACVHGFIDANTGDVYQTLPWDHRGWHCGASANNTHIGIETCEPAKIKYTGGATFTYNSEDLPEIQKTITLTYNSAVSLFARLCKLYNLNPLTSGVIISHKEGHAIGVASNHGDIEHLWTQAKMPYTMDGFRKDVANAMKEIDKELSPNDGGSNPVEDANGVKHYYRVRKGPKDAKSQIGAYLELDKAKAQADAYPGYNVYDWEFKLVYPIQTVPFRIQVIGGETPLTIYKEASTSASKWKSTVGAGIFTIVKIKGGSGSTKGFGLLKSYSTNSNGWINLDSVKHIL